MTSIMTFVSIMVSPETPIVFTFPLPEGYYEKQGVLTVQRSNLYGRRSHPTGVIRLGYPATKTESDMHKVQVDLEKLNLNTCVLNSIGKYRFVFVVDNDEFYSINIPGIFTWQEVRKNAFLKGTPKTTTCFPELQMIQSNEAVQFARDNHLIKMFDSIPSYHYIMSHIHAVEDADERGELPHRRKCIHDLNSIVTVEFHGGRTCLRPDGGYDICVPRMINGREMQSYHYRSKCTSSSGDFGILFFPCQLNHAKYNELLIRDDAWKYLQVVKPRLKRTLTELKLI
ncbi:unnamed protein product [Notodromas monacha]|uniref:Glycosyltransferase family 92 protein n=1 Tax=Notodromas monacha TaxID=399045 RepID=A0A7R9C0Z3_9CRUS|nr:unnamed protein product [Notodromas monacha]CAG0924481.1 unnamed protein product [Notodromas monacha]